MHHRVLVLLASLTASAGTASAQMLYHTGFETPDYVVGASIVGIDDWFAAVSPLAPEVFQNPAQASSGRHALRCWGGGPLESVPIGGGFFLLDGAWAQPVDFEPAYPHEFAVRVQCDVRLDGPDTGSGPANDLVSANLIARNGVGGSASMFLSSTGNVYCFADSIGGSVGYAFETPIVLGAYHTLAITYDYATHMATFEVDGTPVGSLPFGGSPSEGFRGAFLEFAALDDLLVVDPALYTGYWDNLAIAAIPVR